MKTPSFLILLFAVCGCGGTYEPTSPADLAQCYENEFAAKPSPAVRVLNSRSHVYRDQGSHWLRFEMKEDAIAAVILSRGFQKSTHPPSQLISTEYYTPTWWPKMSSAAFDFYENPSWTKGSWSFSRAAIAIERTSGVVYFFGERGD
jgi:hypothetical protein